MIVGLCEQQAAVSAVLHLQDWMHRLSNSQQFCIALYCLNCLTAGKSFGDDFWSVEVPGKLVNEFITVSNSIYTAAILGKYSYKYT